MIGQLGLFIRIGLHVVAGALMTLGWIDYSQEAGTVTIEIDGLAQMIAGALVSLGSFVVSRIVKVKGGVT
jgi:hypothetical protein